jgi:hypothetical protein
VLTLITVKSIVCNRNEEACIHRILIPETKKPA